jgi:hypothetical protein
MDRPNHSPEKIKPSGGFFGKFRFNSVNAAKKNQSSDNLPALSTGNGGSTRIRARSDHRSPSAAAKQNIPSIVAEEFSHPDIETKASENDSVVGGVSSAISILENLISDLKYGLKDHPKIREKVIDAIYALNPSREEMRVTELEQSYLNEVLDPVKASAVTSEVSKWISKDFTPTGQDSRRNFQFLNRSYSTSLAPAIRMVQEPVTESRIKHRSNSMESGNDARKKHTVDSLQVGSFTTNYEVLGFLVRSAQWEFDIFSFSDTCQGAPLSTLMMYYFHSLQISSKFPIDDRTFQNFSSLIERGYNDVPYHNNIHAADVMQCVYYFLTASDFSKHISALDGFIALIAAAVHDLDHKGFNNNFEIESRSKLAIRYNDQSVLENHHIASAFRTMQVEGADILANFSRDERKYIREMLIKAVLGTDMKSHFHLLAQLDAAIETHRKNGSWWDSESLKDREVLLVLAVHSADISSPGRPRDLAVHWTKRLEREWFAQGDAERKLNLPISPMMDRTSPSTEQSQVGFINFIVTPLFKSWSNAVGTGIDTILNFIDSNEQFWKEQISTKDKKK